MRILYNILQLLFLAVFFPFLLIFVCSKEKYRDRIPSRLGFGLKNRLKHHTTTDHTIWLHALSVGEVTSAVPLIQGYKKRYPDSKIIVSVTTQSGREVADKVLSNLADHIIDGPIDILPVVYNFFHQIKPDVYILVETDFWPNLLFLCKQRNIPTVLVNGRVSDESMAGYQRMHFFFQPMFTSLTLLFMQTEHDKLNMVNLLKTDTNIHAIGNLKFDTPMLSIPQLHEKEELFLPENKVFFIAGSTHPGEEEHILKSYIELRVKYPELYLLLAPRDPKRAGDITTLAKKFGLTATLRTSASSRHKNNDFYLIDTIGELNYFYSISSISFVGGSLVKKGGHNPIEPATMGVPVLFGPDMSDFREIAESLLAVGGAHRVTDSSSITQTLTILLSDPKLRTKQGNAARECVKNQCGVVDNHLDYIQNIL